MWRSSLSLLAVLVALCTPAAAAGASEEVAQRAHSMARDVMSPFCPGRTLADCPSPDAAALREQIRAMLQDGVSEERVRSQLREQYGDIVVGVPRGAVGWALPGVLLALGVGVLIYALRRLSASPETAPAPVNAALEAELDADLQSRGL